MDENYYVSAVFVDLQKAFDTVDHKILLQLLNQLGIRGYCNKIIESYLSNREVYTKIDDISSDRQILKTGVPQGSVLGPLLYLLYINNIKEVKLMANYTIYADDTCLIYKSKTEKELEEHVNNDLVQFKRWIDGNCLSINLSKTKYMIFRNKNKDDICINVKIENKCIERVDSIRYLGLQLDDKLSWKKHIESIARKIIPIAAVIGRSSIVDNKVMKMIYNAHILSHVRYLCTVWTQTSQQYINRVQKLLSRALKTLYKFNRLTPTELVFKDTNNLKLDEIVHVEKAKFIYKIIHAEIKTNLVVRYNKDVHRYKTRGAENIRTNKSRTDRVNKGVLKTASVIYNELPIELKHATNLGDFTRKIIRYIKNKSDRV